MAMVLEVFVKNFVRLLTDYVAEEGAILLGVKEELEKLQEQMMNIQFLLEDAEKKKFDSSSIKHWLSELKDVMYDADDVIDLCRIEGHKLLADQNLESRISPPVCCNFSSFFSCLASVPFRHEVGKEIKVINQRLKRINENRKQFNLVRFTKSETQAPDDSRLTSSMSSPSAVGREVDDAAQRLVNHLVGENADEKCRVFAVTGMGGIGKTTIAQKIFNHPQIKTFFNLKLWICVSQNQSGIESLKQVARGVHQTYRDDSTKSELQVMVRDSIAASKSFFLVLDNLWTASVWVNWLAIPLIESNATVRVLVATRDENVAVDMKAVHIHRVELLSEESSWETLCRRLFSAEEAELANELEELGFQIVQRCKGLPLAIKVIAGALARQERTKSVWYDFLHNDAWSITELPDELNGALFHSFDDLPAHLKQCFQYLSLFEEDASLHRPKIAQLWVSEGFITEHERKSMEQLAEGYFDELTKRNLLLRHSVNKNSCKLHDLIRSLAIFLSQDESSFGDSNLRNFNTTIKLRRLSVQYQKNATEVLDSVAYPGAIRTLLAADSNLLLDNERLGRLLRLRVLDIGHTGIEILPNSIGDLVHLRHLNLMHARISEIPESIGQLKCLQYLNLRECRYLRQLPCAITHLYDLRHLDLFGTPINFIPPGIGKLHKLNYLYGFVVPDNNTSSKLEELNYLKQIRKLSICNMERAPSGTTQLKELHNLFSLKLRFSKDCSIQNEEQQLVVEEQLDAMIPPESLRKFCLYDFFGRHFPKWMALPFFEQCVPLLTKLEFKRITSWTQLPALGQLTQLKQLKIRALTKVKSIGPEFLGVDINSTTKIAFPKLEMLAMGNMYELEDWSFDAQDEENESPRLPLMPCLQKLDMDHCPLLTQIPKGLKYSPTKSLSIKSARLTSMKELPTELAELSISNCPELVRVRCPPALKKLSIQNCGALHSVKNLDSVRELYFRDIDALVLPEWLLMFLQQLQSDTNDNFSLHLNCHKKVLPKCQQGGCYWDLIQHIHQVVVYSPNDGHFLRYTKQPYLYIADV